ncbi:PREDICTED: probable signal peptidase complex subunit 2 [Camelina sativa]|uniref:Signal peptidase complex subunit 2 n=1 Tax=Camelina sativa TaxID=90675 RepID=A0ABM1RU63_CAMSA|nr:PREDICTED: probable signal peptidase complex subunit 2 [Camelina sativa]XP_019102551.1 PREDICTED: probable signal peptidase complex subunit 2 [Camelina sativa]
MEEKKAETTNKNVKKANLLDHHSIKHILDESVSDIVTSRGYKEDVRLSNLKLILGTVIIVVALFAQFYNKKFPENRDFLIGCIALYVVLNAVLQLILYTKEKNAILFTYPPEGSFTSTGLVVSSKLPRFSDQYTLTIDSADPKSISAGKSVHLTKSVTQWFTKEGVLVEGLFWKDVEALIKNYAKEEPKKKK